MVGKPIMKVNELLKAVENNDNVWNLYAEGLTATLNQCDGEWATGLIKRYKPRNLAELSMFISCLRPFFNSSRETFITRQKYSTGSEHLDEVLKSSNSFILFQESLMQYFEWLGVTPAESIGLIKKISKKKIKPEDFDNLKERLRKSWIEQTGSKDKFEETFKTINDCMSYGFAAPHALAVAIDSLYGAYLKATYPLEYYTVCLNNYTSSDDKTKRLTEEAKYFGITISDIKFRRSDAVYMCDPETRTIYKGTASVKFLNEKVSHALYEMRDTKFDTFVDFLKVNPCNSKQTEILIRLNYFEEFGGGKKLLKVYELFNELFDRKSMRREIVEGREGWCEVFAKYATVTAKMYKIFNSEMILKELCDVIPDEDFSTLETAQFQYKTLGYINIVEPMLPKEIILVTNLNTTYSPRFTGYCINNGKSCDFKVFKNKQTNRKNIKIINSFKDTPLEDGDVIAAKSFVKLPKMIKTANGFEKDPNNKEWWINQYKKVVM
jgi:DNA polymerase III alpha subunit